MAISQRTYEHGPWDKQDADLEAACVQAPAGEAEAVQRVLGLQPDLVDKADPAEPDLI